MQEGDGEIQSPLHSPRECLDQVVPPIRQLNRIERVVNPLLKHGPVKSVERAENPEVAVRAET